MRAAARPCRVPIKFLGTSEKPDGLEVFHPDRLARRILGMGDVLGLIERAQDIEIEEEEALALEEKLRTASFTLEDYQKMMRQVKRLGRAGDGSRRGRAAQTGIPGGS